MIKNNLIIDLDTVIQDMSNSKSLVRDVFSVIRKRVAQRSPEHIVAVASKKKASPEREVVMKALSTLGIVCREVDAPDKEIFGIFKGLSEQKAGHVALLSSKDVFLPLVFDGLMVERSVKGNFATKRKLSSYGLNSLEKAVSYVALAGEPNPIHKIGPAKALKLIRDQEITDLLASDSPDRFIKSILRQKGKLLENVSHISNLCDEKPSVDLGELKFKRPDAAAAQAISDMYLKNKWVFSEKHSDQLVESIEDPFSLVCMMSKRRSDKIAIKVVDSGVLIHTRGTPMFISSDNPDFKDCLKVVGDQIFKGDMEIYTDNKLELDRLFRRQYDGYDLAQSRRIGNDLECLFYMNERPMPEDFKVDEIVSIFDEGFVKITDRQRRQMREIELPSRFMIADMEANGLAVDIVALGHSLTEVISKRASVAKSIHEIMALPPSKTDEFKVRLRSVLGLSEGESTENSSLKKRFPESKIVQLLLEYEECSNLMSSLDSINSNVVNGKVHSIYNHRSTGRVYSAQPNVQQLPNSSVGDVSAKRPIVASGPNRSLLAFDYDQMDITVLAIASNNRRILDIRKRRGDLHAETAADVFNVPRDQVTDEQRRDAKSINFGLTYGMTAFGLAKSLGGQRSRVEPIIKAYFQKYPEIEQHQQETYVNSQNRGFIQTLGGKRMDYVSKTKTVSCETQSSAAEIMKAAMIMCYEKTRECNIDAFLVMNKHDELVFDVADKDLIRATAIFSEAMRKAPEFAWDREVEDVFSLEVTTGVDLKRRMLVGDSLKVAPSPSI